MRAPFPRVRRPDILLWRSCRAHAAAASRSWAWSTPALDLELPPCSPPRDRASPAPQPAPAQPRRKQSPSSPKKAGKPGKPGRAGKKKMKIAINGCGHGDLDMIYATIRDAERKGGGKVDLLICCGDFQAMRNVDDLHCFACPPKYRAMKDFHKYYTGASTAPVPTLFVGGNHEAANHLWELYYGGWAAPNIYYMGAAGVVNFGGLRIGGLSGIFNDRDYASGHHEVPPYDRSSVRTAYHVRDLEVYRLLKRECTHRAESGAHSKKPKCMQLREKLDVFVSHDWPTHVARYGDTRSLLKCKPYFRKEVETDTLGSPANWQLLQALKPRYWFSGHLHVAYPAMVPHGGGGALPPGSQGAREATRFLATDKPIPRRKYVQIVDVPVKAPGEPTLCYDAEWLAVLRETHGMMNLTRGPTRFPTAFADAPPVALEHVTAVRDALGTAAGALSPIPQDTFTKTVDTSKRGQGSAPTSIPRNPQTEAVLRLLGRPWNLSAIGGTLAGPGLTGDDLLGGDAMVPGDGGDPMFEPVEINNFDPFAFSDDKDRKRPKLSAALAAADAGGGTAAAVAVAAAPSNPEEIDIGTDSD